MALLDFIKNRNHQPTTGKPAPSTPRPETQKDVSKVLSASQLAEFRAVGERLQQATTHLRGQAPQLAGDGGNAALLQKQNNQDKTQAALSPTDRHKGQTVTQQKARGWER